MAASRNPELPGVVGNGVTVDMPEIPDLDKAIAKYQRKKEARCKESAPEIAAKTELRTLLHANRQQLPLNKEGLRFYRCDDRDYVLEEKLKVVKVEEADAE